MNDFKELWMDTWIEIKDFTALDYLSFLEHIKKKQDSLDADQSVVRYRHLQSLIEGSAIARELLTVFRLLVLPLVVAWVLGVAIVLTILIGCDWLRGKGHD
jgi:hypothetical protein